MATASSSFILKHISSLTEEEEDNFLHIYKLVVGIGTDVVRDTFDRFFPPINLVTTLKNEDTKIRSLGKKKRLTAHQIDILLPSSVKRPVNGFDQLPLPIETYMEADLARIKFYRNEVAHADSDKLANTEFKSKWQDLVDGIIRLGGIQYKNVCDELEHAKLSKNCIADLRQGIAILQEEARYNLQQFKHDNIQLKTKVIGLKDELKRKLSHMKEEQDESNLQNCDKMNKLETDLQKIKNQLSKVVNESSVSNRVQKYDRQELYTCMVSILRTQNVRLSYPASLSIEENDIPEFTPIDKVALLIGNFDYRCESPLSCPKSDVHFMTEIFKSLDFKVFSLFNLTKEEMQSIVEEFVKLIGIEVYAVFYFCGHGFEEDGKCYLVPPNARHGYTIHDCTCAEDVLNQMQNHGENSPALIVLILDISRIRSKGMYAYEDIHSGILVKYLKKYLPKRMSVLDVFTSVQEDIGNESQYCHIQIPEIKSNLLQPRRSLADRISTKGHTVAFNQRTVLWNNANVIPPSKEIEFPEIKGKVLLDFVEDVSNMLTIFCTVVPMTMGKSLKYYLGCISKLPKTVSIFGTVRQIQDYPPKTKLVLQDLQKLTEDLEVQVFVVNKQTKQGYDGPTVNLGKPLVGILDLWKPRRQLIE